jgi:hypothetical protein
VSLEIGRSSAGQDAEDAGAGSAGSDCGSASPDEQAGPRAGTADNPLRGSVLAPFVGAGGGSSASPAGQESEPDELGPNGTRAAATGSDDVAEPEADDVAEPDLEDVAEPDLDEPGTGDTADELPADDAADVTPEAGETSSSWRAGAVGAAAAAASLPAPRTDPRLGAGAGSAGVPDGPLLSNAAELRTNWLRVQARFVDDPPEAVSEAADLVEHAAQALVGALRQRQQQLRQVWDGDRRRDAGGRAAAGDGDRPAEAAADSTEQLRLLMRRYRVLFNQICSP